ncbi:hypothetical protein [Bordetella muralis]|uniref:hypothetical protein n=1 Tax=Bordetella muralis TaxID=1649130 RepID=UPI0039F12208
MKIPNPTIWLMFLVALSSPFQGAAEIASCASDWTASPAQFESVIEYDDIHSKANPTVHVLVNGKIAKMMLDTRASVSILWETALLDETPGPDVHRLDAHVASVDAQAAKATLEDDRGNALRHEFHVVRGSVLAADGYSGILSPQALAQNNAVVIDLEKNCFFTSPSFDIRSGSGLDVRRGATIPNPYGVMGIHVELDGSKIPLIVDTGASVTNVLSSLIDSKPKGPKSGRTMDMFGAELQQDEYMRLIDLSINGKIFRSQPVVPNPTINERGILTYGYIGMDILKDRVIYHDGARSEFILMTRDGAADRYETRVE